MQTTAWNFENNSIVMIVENEFHRQQIKREINTILQAIVALTKRQLSLEVRLEKPLIQKEEKQNLPETITLLCETFDGNVAEMRDLVVTQNNIKQEDERTDENQNEYMTTEENEDEF
jgi:chromosomal replication initiation ATPase DnaA